MRIDEALLDSNLLGAGLGDAGTYSTWLSVLRAAFGLKLSTADKALFDAVSGGREAPAAPVAECWVIAGRRSGESRMAGAIAVHVAALVDHHLARGETGTVLVLSATRGQARTVFKYCIGYLEAAPLLAREIESITQDEIRLRNGVVIATHVNNYRSVRGRTILCAICDEISFWHDDTSANPDKEVIRALTPALVHSGGTLCCISTPYRRLGLLWERYRAHFGQDSEDVLVVQGASTAFNPTLKQKMIDRAIADDPEGAEAEWNAQFRADIASFLDDELITSAVRPGPRELPPRREHSYHCFIDASGGKSDSYCMTIGHREGETFIADIVIGQPPKFNPAEVTERFAQVVHAYGIRRVTGDNYGAEWVATAWRSHGLGYDRSDLPASQLYQECVPLFTREQISIPDHPQLIRHLRLLERRTSRMGKDAITHPPGGHDDFANSLAGCARIATARGPGCFTAAIRGPFECSCQPK
jgi:hypothetical protein